MGKLWKLGKTKKTKTLWKKSVNEEDYEAKLWLSHAIFKILLMKWPGYIIWFFLIRCYHMLSLFFFGFFWAAGWNFRGSIWVEGCTWKCFITGTKCCLGDGAKWSPQEWSGWGSWWFYWTVYALLDYSHLSHVLTCYCILCLCCSSCV